MYNLSNLIRQYLKKNQNTLNIKCKVYWIYYFVDTTLNYSILGKSTGIVTTARITHATPAAAYAHSAARAWEGDTEIDRFTKAEGCKDIAYQLVKNNPDIKVNTNLMFHGRRILYFTNIARELGNEIMIVLFGFIKYEISMI